MAAKAAMIVTYVGDIPPIFHLTVRSACQSGIDTVFFAGTKPPKMYPNMVWLPETLASLSARARRVLPGYPELRDAYKLCDLKPLTYYMFEEELQGYDWFMYQDLDAMCGNFDIVRNTMTFLRSRFDALSHHPLRFGGHWQLFTTRVFREHRQRWFEAFNRERAIFDDPVPSVGRVDEYWMTECYRKLGFRAAFAPLFENVYAPRPNIGDATWSDVTYDGRNLVQTQNGLHIWTFHFVMRYKDPDFMAVPVEVYEANDLYITRRPGPGESPVRRLA
jgi:hypothetical protein